ncbi:OLC1v1026326C1 [Oldenlandia corymbosa var. corymbosa]|uniref:OLC1v1026326C1 n=1 Tax=Oldenlandia corymbosa var. corymbosa TaxID=529605 RepID=A0AAV1CA50_OLDCO|nr:OLC1v1026326C1 [Oldenlandia corymbosa var. corymbosa]
MAPSNLMNMTNLVVFVAISVFILWLSSKMVAAQPGPIPFPPLKPLPPKPQPTPIVFPPLKPKPPKPRVVKCRLIEFPKCFNIPFLCPLECLTNCFVDCGTCKPVCSCNFPGAVCQDPRFVGGDGNTFYFHGRKDEDFCLITDTNLHVNGHFIGKRNPSLRRDFTWVQAIGVMFDNHRILVAAKRTSIWDDSVDRLAISFDGNPIILPTNEGSKWGFSDVSNVIITRTTNTNGVRVEVLNNFRITAAVVPITAEESRVHGYNITDEDCFAHLELGFKFFNISDGVHGVLGQTYRSNYVSKMKLNAVMPVMGGAHKYFSTGLFSTDCAVSRFGGNVARKAGGGSAALLHHPAEFHCHSGMRGNGLVCK